MDAVPRTVPAHFELSRQRQGERPIQEDRDGRVSMEALTARAAAAAEGLRKIGVRPGDRVGLLADNSRDWIVSDLAIQLARGVSVPRGTDTPVDEIAFLFAHAEVGVVLAHDGKSAQALEAIRDRVPTMGEIVSIAAREAPGRTLDDLVASGEDGPSYAEQAAAVTPDDVATIIYTSGTTGRPKGVVLTQSNFGHQVSVLPALVRMNPEEVFLSILPPWHSFERTVEYAAFTAGSRVCYTDRRRFKDDLVRYRPTFLASVPRLWETVYDGVMKAVQKGGGLRRALFKGAYAVSSAHLWGKSRARGHVLRVRVPHGIRKVDDAVVRGLALLTAGLTWPFERLASKVVFGKVRAATGGRMRGAISGGGLMPPHIERFFCTIGVPIMVGYGLTETSPVVAVRREERNVLGTIGTAVPEVEIEIRDPSTGAPLEPGRPGLVFTRGPHIMRGYHKDEHLTREVIDANGWFNTGDLGYLTEEGDLCFRGRAKETIVLAGGENVEPSRVEAALLASPFIEQALVVGQDRKTLAALLLPQVDEVAKALHIAGRPSYEELAADDAVKRFLHQEVVRATAGLAPFERITRLSLLPRALDVADGTLTQTLKLKRHVITERYEGLIEEAYGG